MNTISKLTLACCFAGLSAHAFAEEKNPDPSDLTQTSTSAFVGMSNQGAVKGSVSADIKVNATQTAMFTIEGTMNKEGHYSDARIQYFHVFNTDSAFVPKVAASIDVIDNEMFSSASVGSTIAINSGVKGLNIFPRVGALAGKYSSDALNHFGVTNDEAFGVSAALYVTYTMGEDGSYIGAWPEYNYLGGDIDASILKTTIMMATPISADKKSWGQIRIDNTNMNMVSNSQTVETNDTVVWANYKFYF